MRERKCLQPEAASCLLLGCEDGRILILNATGTAVHSTLSVGAPPALLSASGTLSGGYRLSAATRDGRLHTLRPAEGGSAAVVQLEAQAVGLVSEGRRASLPWWFHWPNLILGGPAVP